MKSFYRLSVGILFLLLCCLNDGLAQTNKVKRTVLQVFWWDYRHDAFPGSWADYLTKLAPRLKGLGIDAIWIPPSYKNQSPTWVGYGPMDHYDLGDKFQKGSPDVHTGMGTKDELLRMIAVMHANGIEVIQDIVLNHVDGAGSQQGNGGVDSHPLSLQSNSGYKNFRYVSYATPALDESVDDYFTRNGRWPKNYANFYPNANHSCCNNDINSPYFGPDISYESDGIGQSSVIPLSGHPAGYSTARPYINPVQLSSYMRSEARNWLLWFKKQTGVDGLRWDAVKHFPIDVQEDLIYNVKYSLPDWAKGGQTMLNIGEWIGSKSDIDNYVNAVASGCAPTGDTNNGCSSGNGREEHTGTFDFSLRGYGDSGGLYAMIRGGGAYNVALLPGDQQSKRYFDYYSIDTRVHRSFSFVNSHDTYRPQLTQNGDFTVTLSNSYNDGWNTGSELGGNGGHLDPREPRMAAAYASCLAMDGNTVIFFEDLFDIGTTGQRYSHDPLNQSQLPVQNDLDNLILAHGRLGFKEGDYRVRTSENNPAPYFQTGNSGDHLVFERAGKVIVGISDAYAAVADNSADQEVWVNTDFPIGTQLYDYSGAHGTQTVTVVDHFGDTNIHRVLIKTSPAGHLIAGAHGHGYSLWAPAPPNTSVSTVQDLYDYLASYSPARNSLTTQEWEMDNDLGDSHCSSLGQGGRLPENSFGQRVAGKVYVKGSTSLGVEVNSTDPLQAITVYIANRDGVVLKKAEGTGTIFTNLVVPGSDWYTIKIRNANDQNTGQKCFIKAIYQSEASISDPLGASAANTGFVWTGNALTDDWADCRNWEEGRIPGQTDDIHIPEMVDIYPRLISGFSGQILIEPGSFPLATNGIDLRVEEGEREIVISWSLEQSSTSVKYKLLRSEDGKTFTELSEPSNRQFSYMDSEISFNKVYYYQLEVTTESGELLYSEIKKGICRGTKSDNLLVWPNPTSSTSVQLYIPGGHKGYEYFVFDAQGKLCLQGKSLDQVTELSTNGLADGIYLIKARFNQDFLVTKFIKTK